MSSELDYARQLVSQALYAPEHYTDVIILACAASHRIQDFNSAPRVLSLGLKGSGKSTVLTIASMLAANTTQVTGVLAMSAPSYVAEFRMNPLWTPTIDEVNHLFGEAGQNGKQSKFYTYLNQGHLRRTGTAQYQENKVPLHIPIFGIAFLAGLGLAVPPDLRERSVVLKMSKAPKSASVADFSDEEVLAEFEYGKRCLSSWTRTLPRLRVKDVRGAHPELRHRMMDVWGPLFTVAKAAGDDWLKRCTLAFERVELDNPVAVHPPDVQLSLDYLEFAESRQLQSVASGEFAQWAMSREHGAYMAKKPGQFRQFATSILGPTVAFYDAELARTKRGWTGAVHAMNMENGRRLRDDIQAGHDSLKSEDSGEWEDF